MTKQLPPGVFDMSPDGGNAPAMNDAVAEALHDFLESADDKAQDKAKYKLELSFTEARSKHRPYAGLISAWSNGGFASGGGDEVIYFCKQVLPSGKHCAAPIDMAFINKKMALCPECKQPCVPRELVGQIFLRLHTQQWVQVITKYFNRLGGDADLRLCIMKGDLHSATDKLMDGNPDSIRAHRQNRQWVIYPLDSIVKDMAAGASFESRVRAFLEA